MVDSPLVSVVIPTRGRPQLLVRAITSALSQTYTNLEVVVIVDGPDDETDRAVKQIEDPRVRAVILPVNVGGGEARNAGVLESKGDWIAFLDDDDEWESSKLDKQILLAESLQDKNAFISCRLVEKLDNRSDIYPFRLPDPDESICSYVCCPRGFRVGGEILQTSTLLVRRDLMIAVPFVRGLKRGQDFIWQIEAGTRGNARFYVLPEVLSILNSGSRTDTKRVSSKPNWRALYACIQQKRELFEPRAYAYCIGTRVLTDAQRAGEGPLVVVRLLIDLIRTGSASPKIVSLFLSLWILPDGARNWIGRTVRAMKNGPNPEKGSDLS